jgi:hypothetical protein
MIRPQPQLARLPHLCRLNLDDAVPDHSTFSKNRHGRFREADILRHVFEATVQTCMDAGLVGGEGFAADASIIRANANRQNSVPGGDDHDWTSGAGGKGPSRPVREYLAALDQDAEPPKEISLSDPASRLTAAVGKPAFFGWSTNYLINVKNAVIMDVEETPSVPGAEVGSTQIMIDRVENLFGVKPKRLIGDTAYGTAEMVAWMVEEKSIEPHVPLREKGERDDGTFSRSDFVFDATSNTMTCPGGKRLLQYRYSHFERERSGITKPTPEYIVQATPIAECAVSNKNAVPINSGGKSFEAYTKPHAT